MRSAAGSGLHAGTGSSSLRAYSQSSLLQISWRPWRFVILFLTLAACGDAFYLARDGSAPACGASGAIAGLMTLTLFQAPRAEMVTGISWFMRRLQVWFVVGLWLAVEFLLAGDATDGVAHAAHLGGALGGCVAAWVLRNPRLEGSRWYFPREPEGGAPQTQAYRELMAGESAWKAIYEHQKRQREMRGD